jgi:hypothetical protein
MLHFTAHGYEPNCMSSYPGVCRETDRSVRVKWLCWNARGTYAGHGMVHSSLPAEGTTPAGKPGYLVSRQRLAFKKNTSLKAFMDV